MNHVCGPSAGSGIKRQQVQASAAKREIRDAKNRNIIPSQRAYSNETIATSRILAWRAHSSHHEERPAISRRHCRAVNYQMHEIYTPCSISRLPLNSSRSLPAAAAAQ
jgi:hypothetical protein